MKLHTVAGIALGLVSISLKVLARTAESRAIGSGANLVA